MKTIKRIQNRINAIAKEYVENGYKVIVEPRSEDLPKFLSSFMPDIIALKDDDKVVIEVKSKESLKKTKKLEELASIVEGKSNWRFELIVSNPKDNIKDIEYAKKELEYINNNLNNLKKGIEGKIDHTLFMVAWTVFEKAIPLRFAIDRIHIENKSTNALIRTLYSYGHINKKELWQLNECINFRNHVVHGKKPPKRFGSEITNTLQKLTNKILKDIDDKD